LRSDRAGYWDLARTRRKLRAATLCNHVCVFRTAAIHHRGAGFWNRATGRNRWSDADQNWGGWKAFLRIRIQIAYSAVDEISSKDHSAAFATNAPTMAIFGRSSA